MQSKRGQILKIMLMLILFIAFAVIAYYIVVHNVVKPILK